MAGRNDLPGLGLWGFWNLGEDGWKPGMDENMLRLSTLVQLNVFSRVEALPETPSQGDRYIVPAGEHVNKIAIYDDSVWVYLVPTQGWIAHVIDEGLNYQYDGAAWLPFTGETPVAAQVGYTPPESPGPDNVQDALDFLDLRVSMLEGESDGGSSGPTYLGFGSQSGSFEITAAMHDTMQKCSDSSPIVATIPTDDSDDLPNGFSVSFLQVGAGEVIIDAPSGITLLYPDDALPQTRGPMSVITALKSDEADTWIVFGDMAAAESA